MNFDEHIKNIDYNGYTIIKNLISKDDCDIYTNLIEKYSTEEYSYKIGNNLNTEWDGKWLYNLQNKDYKFFNLLNNNFLENILKYKLNDKFYRNQEGEDPNYILQIFTARASGKKKLDMHSDIRTKTCNYKSTLGITIIWYLKDTNIDNGCTYLVPGSHLINLAQEEPYITDRDFKNVVPVEVSAGDVLVFDQALWHGAYANQTSDIPWRIQTAYNRWWIKPSFDIPNTIPDDFYKKLSNKEKSILGFCSQPSYNEFERINMTKAYNDLK